MLLRYQSLTILQSTVLSVNGQILHFVSSFLYTVGRYGTSIRYGTQSYRAGTVPYLFFSHPYMCLLYSRQAPYSKSTATGTVPTLQVPCTSFFCLVRSSRPFYIFHLQYLSNILNSRFVEFRVQRYTPAVFSPCFLLDSLPLDIVHVLFFYSHFNYQFLLFKGSVSRLVRHRLPYII